MNEIISELKTYSDLHKLTEDSYDKWVEKSALDLEKLREFPTSTEDVAKFFTYIEAQLVETDFPRHDTHGASFICYVIKDVIEGLRSQTQQENKYNAELFDLILLCLKAGPGSGHLEVMNDLPVQKEFYEKIDAGGLLRLLEAYAGPILENPAPEDYHKGDLSDFLEKPLKDINGKQFKICQEQVRNLWLSLSFRQMEASETVAYILRNVSTRLCDILESSLDVSVYKYSDRTVVKGHLDRIKKIMMDKEYPKSEEAQISAKDLLQNIVKYIEKDSGVRRRVIVDVKVMVIDMMLSDSRQGQDDVAETLNSFLEGHESEIKSNEDLQQHIVNNLIAAIKKIQPNEEDSAFWYNHYNAVASNLIENATPDKYEISLQFILACLDCGQYYVISEAAELMDKEDAFDWKNYPEPAFKIFDRMISYEKQTKADHNYKSLKENFIHSLRTQNVLSKYKNYLKALNVDTSDEHDTTQTEPNQENKTTGVTMTTPPTKTRLCVLL